MRDLNLAYQRIISRSEFVASGCLECSYSVGSHGYTQAWDGDSVVLSHRIVWEKNNGPIMNGMTVDHICKNRRCVNIKHLRLLTNVDNATDNGQIKTNLEVESLCKKGLHKMVVNPKGVRYCRECKQLRRKERRRSGEIK